MKIAAYSYRIPAAYRGPLLSISLTCGSVLRLEATSGRDGEDAVKWRRYPMGAGVGYDERFGGLDADPGEVLAHAFGPNVQIMGVWRYRGVVDIGTHGAD